MKITLSILILILLNACSSLSKEDCTNKNWLNLGKEDALSGEVEPKTANYRKDCSKYGLQIKSMDYLKGFELGLKEYCTYYNGLYRGKEGSASHSLCEEVNPDYKKGYLIGLREFKRKESIVELKKKLIEENGGKECSFSSDCMTEGVCSFNKCEKSQEECSFNSDCKYQGSCESSSAWTDFNDNVSVNTCKF